MNMLMTCRYLLFSSPFYNRFYAFLPEGKYSMVSTDTSKDRILIKDVTSWLNQNKTKLDGIKKLTPARHYAADP